MEHTEKKNARVKIGGYMLRERVPHTPYFALTFPPLGGPAMSRGWGGGVERIFFWVVLCAIFP